MQGVTIWLTGGDGAKMSAVAQETQARLKVIARRPVAVLSEGEIEKRLCSGQPPEEGLAEGRLGWLCGLLARNGAVAIAVSPSPRRARRDAIRHAIGNFVEVWVESPGGEGPGYEPPHYPEVRIGAPIDSTAGASAIEKALEAAGYLGGAENVYRGDEEERVKERLKNLGYID